MLLEGLQPQALPCSTLYVRDTVLSSPFLVFLHKTHGECMCSAPRSGEHWSGWSKLINKELYATKTSGLHSLPSCSLLSLVFS